MALDDRQKQIQTSAGLEDARVNQDFIDLLKRFSTPLLVVVLLVVGGYVGINKLKESREAKLGEAFAQLEAATKAGNPTNLLRVAEDFPGQGEISTLARLAAADIYISAAIKGLVPGAELNPDGSVKNADDVLSADKRTALLNDAKAQYQRVLDATRSDKFKASHSIGALFGLAAVAETQGNAGDAKTAYAAAVTIAAEAGLPALGDIAKARSEDAEKFLGGVRLLAASEIKSKPQPPAPTPPPTPLMVPDAPAAVPVTPVVPATAPAPATDPAAPAPGTAPASAPAPAAAPAPSPSPAPAPADPATAPK